MNKGKKNYMRVIYKIQRPDAGNPTAPLYLFQKKIIERRSNQ